jgi:serine/threonine-protein kinase
MDLTGAEVGPFDVWGPIGEGGMSRVFLARHRRLSMPVVIKTLRDTGIPDEAEDRLSTEAQLMARIPSPRVVRPVDVGVHEGCAYFAQEYVDGLDLSELDRRRRRALGRGLPLWFVCQAIGEVAEALESAHQTGVLHRDVKPSNLFGSPQTGMRLGDFGIARLRRTKEDVAVGTLRFVAPEALRGETLTRRCDSYSLGATAYDLYYGRPPFDAINEILGSAPVPFPAAKSPQEAYFQHLVGRLLERMPEKRFPSLAAARRLLFMLAREIRPSLPAIHVSRGVYQLGGMRIICEIGDIAQAHVDGIVNSARSEMRMEGGVGRSLKARGGQAIEEEAIRGGKRALGDCVSTTGGDLACRAVLHAVSAWKEASCIARTCQRAFLLAEELSLRTLAIPALGTGLARVSPESSAYATMSALQHHVMLGGSRLREVRFVLHDRETFEIYVDEFDEMLLGDAHGHDVEGTRSAADPTTDETIYLPAAPPSVARESLREGAAAAPGQGRPRP